MAKETKDNINFQYVELEPEQELLQKNFDKNNHLLFMLSGELEVVYGSLKPRIVSGNNMILLSSLSNCICKTLSFSKFILLEFKDLNLGCDQYVFQELIPIYSLIKYEFQELEIRPPLNLFLDSVQEYLIREGMIRELFVEKQKELIMLLRAFYDLEELTMLFYPLLGKNMEFKRLVMDNYSRVKNAAEYADLCGYSLGVFQRKFKEVFGETVYQWMQKQKAEQIKHRLMVSDVNPKELAEEFDFASPAHLNKFCKIWFGMTPSELRQTYLLKKKLK